MVVSWIHPLTACADQQSLMLPLVLSLLQSHWDAFPHQCQTRPLWIQHPVECLVQYLLHITKGECLISYDQLYTQKIYRLTLLGFSFWQHLGTHLILSGGFLTYKQPPDRNMAIDITTTPAEFKHD